LLVAGYNPLHLRSVNTKICKIKSEKMSLYRGVQTRAIPLKTAQNGRVLSSQCPISSDGKVAFANSPRGPSMGPIVPPRGEAPSPRVLGPHGQVGAWHVCYSNIYNFGLPRYVFPARWKLSLGIRDPEPRQKCSHNHFITHPLQRGPKSYSKG
jgi:hypothetical protein